jgi:predicted DNA-binding transcriptional regulator AlpA
MKTSKTAEQLDLEAENIEFELANALSPNSWVTSGGDVIHVAAKENTPEIKRLRGIHDRIVREKLVLKKALSNNNNVVRGIQHCARRPRQRGASTNSSEKSGDSNNNNDDAEPEPERPLLSPNLYSEATLADLLIISKKSVQNIYSKNPHLLPKAISIPGARGPRWTSQAIEEWLATRPQYPSKSVPVAPKRSVGRPRIASAKGGAS